MQFRKASPVQVKGKEFPSTKVKRSALAVPDTVLGSSASLLYGPEHDKTHFGIGFTKTMEKFQGNREQCGLWVHYAYRDSTVFVCS